MAGRCVDKRSHSCGTTNALQVFEKEDGSGYDGWCFKCKQFVADPYANEPEGYKPPEGYTRSDADIEEELEEITSCRAMDLPTRKISAKWLEIFGVKVGVDPADGKTPRSVHFPYHRRSDGKLVRYKNRLLANKKIWATGSNDDLGLFGFERAKEIGGKTLYITEGEYDTVALTAILETYGNSNYNTPPVVSLINGAGNAKKELANNLVEIKKRWQTVVLVFDDDKPGQQAAEEVSSLEPDLFKVGTLNFKDANEVLLKGSNLQRKSAYEAVYWNPTTVTSSRLVNAKDYFEEAKEPAKMGLSWPWDKLTRLTRGRRRGETYYWGAGVKMGKSVLVNALADHIMQVHGLPVMLCKPEESPVTTTKLVAGYMSGNIFHDPNIPYTAKSFDEATMLIGDKLHLVDSYQDIKWSDLKIDIKRLASLGVKDFIIDPITNLTNGSASEINEQLLKIAKESATLAQSEDITIDIFCHLNAPATGLAHERGGRVESKQFAGSRSMMRSCDYMFGLQGNKDPDLPYEEQNFRDLAVLEARKYGTTGIVSLHWCDVTGRFSEVNG